MRQRREASRSLARSSTRQRTTADGTGSRRRSKKYETKKAYRRSGERERRGLGDLHNAPQSKISASNGGGRGSRTACGQRMGRAAKSTMSQATDETMSGACVPSARRREPATAAATGRAAIGRRRATAGAAAAAGNVTTPNTRRSVSTGRLNGAAQSRRTRALQATTSTQTVESPRRPHSRHDTHADAKRQSKQASEGQCTEPRTVRGGWVSGSRDAAG